MNEEEGMTPAQIRAKRRKEKILMSSAERMALVSGAAKSLEPLPKENAITHEDVEENKSEQLDALEPSAEESPMKTETTWEERRKRAVEKNIDEEKLAKAQEIVEKVHEVVDEAIIEKQKQELEEIRKTLAERKAQEALAPPRETVQEKIRFHQDRVSAYYMYQCMRMASIVSTGVFLAYMAFDAQKANLKLGSAFRDYFFPSTPTIAEMDEDFGDAEIYLEEKASADRITKKHMYRKGINFQEVFFGSQELIYWPLALICFIEELIMIATVKLTFFQSNPPIIAKRPEERGMMLNMAVNFGGEKVKQALVIFEFLGGFFNDLMATLVFFVLTVATLVIREENNARNIY